MGDRVIQGALLILRDGHGRVLLQERGDDAPVYPGMWGLFGGAVEVGETAREALVREAMEELRYDAGRAELAFVFRGVDPVRGACERHYFVDDYLGDQVLELHEGRGMGWFALDEMGALDLAPNVTLEMERLGEIVGGRGERG